MLSGHCCKLLPSKTTTTVHKNTHTHKYSHPQKKEKHRKQQTPILVQPLEQRFLPERMLCAERCLPVRTSLRQKGNNKSSPARHPPTLCQYSKQSPTSTWKNEHTHIFTSKHWLFVSLWLGSHRNHRPTNRVCQPKHKITPTHKHTGTLKVWIRVAHYCMGFFLNAQI